MPAQPSHARGYQGLAGSREPLLLHGNQAGMATERFSSRQKLGILRSAHSKSWRAPGSVRTPIWDCSCAPGEPHLPLQNLSPSEHPLLCGSAPAVANPTADPTQECPTHTGHSQRHQCPPGTSPIPCQTSRNTKPLPEWVWDWLDVARPVQGQRGCGSIPEHVPGTGAAAPSCSIPASPRCALEKIKKKRNPTPSH